jgi:hypothetical protein
MVDYFYLIMIKIDDINYEKLDLILDTSPIEAEKCDAGVTDAFSFY